MITSRCKMVKIGAMVFEIFHFEVRNPLIDNENYKYEMTTIEKEILIELSCDSSLKQKFQTETLIQF